jgi:hypothetical protein
MHSVQRIIDFLYVDHIAQSLHPLGETPCCGRDDGEPTAETGSLASGRRIAS